MHPEKKRKCLEPYSAGLDNSGPPSLPANQAKRWTANFFCGSQLLSSTTAAWTRLRTQDIARVDGGFMGAWPDADRQGPPATGPGVSKVTDPEGCPRYLGINPSTKQSEEIL